jgi:protein-S-isoprenylcysteine O-methyltransferase Ste14
MTNRGKAEEVAGSSEHLHMDRQVTRARLECFAAADVEVQLEVLASLRAKAADQEATQTLALQSMAVAVLAIFLAFVPGIVPQTRTVSLDPSAWIISAIAVLVVVILIVLAPVVVDQTRLSRKRERATVWLGAYEDELNRHRSGRGRAARRWRREHPL